MKETFNDLESAREFAETLYTNEKNYVEFLKKGDCIEVHWVEMKTYTTFDGKEFVDERWTTQAGELLLIQDLTPDHSKNIIRMMLRREREAQEYFENLAEILGNYVDSLEDVKAMEPDSSRILH